ncbi:hypothetical protein [Tenacibaculum finnmarkense]|uniref:hypothetical protein n=1 Tax=Tenacibaculum finnmarkense TaxID=2781243 RepID=UPI001EFB3D60|nr:hypothetical protein [Tenacibaculum finnmarkense]MCG8796586.1 hypothetical protein [Tenacibaculum finnmarkense]MCG8798916.1 hypothetical protein [Tenacibaculum finnmarkense]
MEKLLKLFKEKAQDCTLNTKESRARKGAYVDCIVELEKTMDNCTGLNVLYQKGDKVTFGNRDAIIISCDGNFADIDFIGSNAIYEGVDISFLEPN